MRKLAIQWRHFEKEGRTCDRCAATSHAAVDETPCPSCSCLSDSETICRSVKYQGETFEGIPAELIRKAAYKAIEYM